MRFHRHFLLPLLSLVLLTGCTAGKTLTSPWSTTSQREATQAPKTLDNQASTPQTIATPAPQQTQQTDSFANLPPVKVGILLPLSGQHAGIGQSMLQAAQLALFDMGYENFELMPRDTQGTAQGAVQATNAALNDGAQLLLGPLFADEARAASPIAAGKRVMMVTFSTDWTLASNNTFVMGFLPFGQVQRISRYAAANGLRNIGLLAASDKYGQAVSQIFQKNAQQNAIVITKTQMVSANETNLTGKLQAFTQGQGGYAPYQAVFMPLGGAQAQSAAAALSQYGLTPDKIKRLGTGLMDSPELARDPNLQGALFAAPSPRLRGSFERRYQGTFNENPHRLSTLAYDATALAAVLARTGFSTTGRPAYDAQSMMNPNGFSGVDGIFRFRSDGLIDRGLAVLEIRNGTIVEIDPSPTTFQSLGY